jgi:hypothetical protein
MIFYALSLGYLFNIMKWGQWVISKHAILKTYNRIPQVNFFTRF